MMRLGLLAAAVLISCPPAFAQEAYYRFCFDLASQVARGRYDVFGDRDPAGTVCRAREIGAKATRFGDAEAAKSCSVAADAVAQEFARRFPISGANQIREKCR